MQKDNLQYLVINEKRLQSAECIKKCILLAIIHLKMKIKSG